MGFPYFSRFDVDESNVNEIFPLAIRARIVQFILRRKSYKTQDELKDDEFAFGYERLVQQGVYDAAYPLHDVRQNLRHFCQTEQTECVIGIYVKSIKLIEF